MTDAAADTYQNKQAALQAAIIAALPDSDDDADHVVYVLDFSDTFVIYCVGWDEYLQDDYTVEPDGSVKLAGKPVPVKSVTTYVPVEAGHAGRMEQRGRSPFAQLRQAPTRIVAEPLTYRRGGRESYFRDLLLTDRVSGASQRLERHAAEMEMEHATREKSATVARGRLEEQGFEYRVEPSTTQTFGGYFAPPLWLVNLFAPARHAQRVLADLIPGSFPLPVGVSSINLPIISTGAVVAPMVDNQAVADQDITDAAGTSKVVTFAGDVDVSLQALEQSPTGAHLDWAFFSEMCADYDAQLEYQLLYGGGPALSQLTGITQVASIIGVTYTDASPTGTKMYPYLGQAVAQLGDARDLSPEVWIMRTARWAWLTTETSTAGLPFGLPSPFFMGNDEDTPDPVSGLLGFPVFLDDALPATLGVGGNQDSIVSCRPTDLIFLEGEYQTNVYREPLSGALGARLQLHNSVAFISNRYPSGISVVSGTGMVVQSGY